MTTATTSKRKATRADKVFYQFRIKESGRFSGGCWIKKDIDDVLFKEAQKQGQDFNAFVSAKITDLLMSYMQARKAA
jgi:hypothetical protein